MRKTKATRRISPASTCALCGRTLKDVGGKRLNASPFLGVDVWPEPPLGGSAGLPVDFCPVDENEAQYLIFWGALWTKGKVQTALATARKGKRPWFCQSCRQRACEEALLPFPGCRQAKAYCIGTGEQKLKTGRAKAPLAKRERALPKKSEKSHGREHS